MSLVEDVERPTESMPLLAQGGDEFKVPQKIFVEELYILPRYALPVLGSQILEYSMSIVNIVSIGHLSTTALAAISLGSMASAVTGFSVLNGLASGLETVLPTAFTSSEPQLVGLWTQRMARVPHMAKCRANIPDYETRPGGGSPGHVVLAMDVAGLTSRGSQHNWPHVFYLGAAVPDDRSQYGALNGMGPTTLAAHSILVTTSAMAFQLHFSNVDATTVRIGNLLGERNDIRAGIASRAGLAIALMSATFTCSSLLMARTSWPRLFNDDPAVVLLVSRVLPIIAMFQFIDATNAMGAGFLRVRGKQFIGGLMNVRPAAGIVVRVQV
ncbi:hypothetical protein DXG01_007343 [Tephrocybe rancida]|nr:hypothetical protein DXG01_007343 [Tephrocybe rancida]